MEDAFVTLVRSILSGDRAGVAGLLNAKRSDLQEMVRQKLRNRRPGEDQEGILQTVLLRLVIWLTETKPELKCETDLDHLVAAIAAHAVTDALRHSRCEKKHRDARALDEIPEAAGPVAKELGPSVAVERRDLFKKAIAIMTPAGRRIAMRRARGQKWEVIAEKEKTTVASCRGIVAREYSKIRRRLPPPRLE
jgi:DNA-directed RNA polymerase specialized sigma24 family protein